MSDHKQWWHWLWALCLALGLAGNTLAAENPKPFAEKRIVLQISDPDPFKQTLVLNVASNLVKYYGPDKVDIEIVAFGPGLRLLLAENANAGRIDSLAEGAGVRFSACDNTFAKYTKALGREPALNPRARHVKAGVVRIIELMKQGYHLIKP
ncbi:DsrE family protein [Thiohalobacter sp.]|uniref:DsrE family protein n=1 Tax=Thiohalobacter sp. TaxID=2025948 RepID=UPI00262975A5|nr:hypothetical protein [Thiohalobacter sp.]